jgi:hypothetical protein
LITNKGKSLVAKYMLGQIPSYGSYLALGCGAPPSTTTSKTPTSYSISGSTVTVTISGGHTFKVGDNIIVDMSDDRVDGNKTIATVTSTQLTFPANYTIPSLTAVNDAFPGNGYALFTAASAHRLIVGDVITTTDFAGALAVFNNTDVAVYAVPSSTTFITLEASVQATTGTGTLSIIKPTVQGGATISLDYSGKASLDFEMLRVPIISRGLATEDGVDMLVLGAEAPTQERLSITELGIYSAGTNNLVRGSQSGVLHTFANYENWELHNTATQAVVDFPTGLSTDYGATIGLSLATPATYFGADRAIFENAERTSKQERPRMYNSTLVLNGKLSYIQNVDNLSTMAVATGSGNIGSGIQDSRHIHLLGQTYAFDENSSSDKIKVAFSILYKKVVPQPDGTSPNSAPSYIGIIIEFSSETATENPKYARLKISKDSTQLAGSRYFAESVPLSNLEVSNNFSWSAVDTIKVYFSAFGASPYTAANLSDEYSLALDAISFENVYDEEQNTSYGLVAYSTVGSTKTIAGTNYIVPIEKNINNSTLVEYKFPIIVGDR